MKKRNLFITLGLALGLGVAGVAGLAQGKEAVEVDATVDTMTIYYIQRSDWGGDYAYDPYIWRWGGNNPANGGEYKLSWDDRPMMTWIRDVYNGDGVQGKLWKYDLPLDITGFLIRQNNTESKPEFSDTDVTLASIGKNAFHMDSTGGNHLKAFNLTYVEDGAYLRGNWNDGAGWNIEEQRAMTTVTAGTKYKVDGVDLSAGNYVKMVYIVNGSESFWGEFHDVSSTDDENYPVAAIDDGDGHTNAGVYSTGTYNITVTKFAEGQWDYEFEGTANEDLDAACAFARTFVSALFAECPYNWSESQTQGQDIYNDGKTSETLATVWGQQKVAFLALSEGVQSYLTNKKATAVDITNMFGRYDYVYGKYATVRAVQGADFLGRTPTITANLTIASGIINNETAPVYAIAIIAAASLVTLGGVFLLRRKEN